MQVKTGLTTLLLLGLGTSLAISGCGDDEAKKDPRCDPGESVCTSEFTGVVCPEVGPAQTFECVGGDVCEEGACVGEECVPESAECAGDSVVRTCASDGKTWVTKACEVGQVCQELSESNGEGGGSNGGGAASCVPGDGEQLCDPGAVECATATAYKTCEIDGSAWVVTECGPDEICENGACVLGDDCSNAEPFCQGEDAAIVCNDGMYERVACENGTTCLDGVCVGPVCKPDSTRCDFPSVAEILSRLQRGGPGLEPEELGERWRCNEDGTGWERDDCSAGEFCVFDGVAQQAALDFGEALGTWALQCMELGGCQVSDAPRPPSVGMYPSASCVTPECDTPYFDVTAFDAFYYYGGNTSELLWDGVAATCGDATDPSDGNVLRSFSTCVGFPPFANLHWENTPCEAHEWCTFDGAGPGRGIVSCDAQCTPNQTACAGDTSFYTCTEEGTFGEVESCGLDDNGLELGCVPESPVTGKGHRCIDRVCAYWERMPAPLLDEDGAKIPLGACDNDGMFHLCEDGELNAGEACDVGTCRQHTSQDSPFNGYETPGFCASECEDGDEICLWQLSGNAPAQSYVECIDGRWSNVHQYCANGTACRRDPLDPAYDGSVLCENECYPGGIVCAGEVGRELYYDCGNNGQPDLEDPQTCEYGVCSGYRCVAECRDGDVRCSGLTAEQTCVDGRWQDPIACAANTYCRTGYVGAREAFFGCVECIGEGSNYYYRAADAYCDVQTNELIRCTADNTWADPEACGQGEICQASYLSAVAANPPIHSAIHGSVHAICTPGQIVQPPAPEEPAPEQP